MTRSVVVATYNIHLGIGGDGQFMPDRIASVIKAMDADVVALQEVALGGSGFDMLAYLAQQCAMTPVAGPTVRSSKGDYGNAVLTRLPVKTVNRLDLSVAGREPRGALDIEFDCAGNALHVLSTHLGLMPGERRLQVRALIAHLNATVAQPTVLLGDLNEWFLWGRPLRWLHRFFDETPAQATFPARRPLLALDRIWVRPSASLRRLDVMRGAIERLASDHLPLRAELQLHCGQNMSAMPVMLGD